MSRTPRIPMVASTFCRLRTMPVGHQAPPLPLKPATLRVEAGEGPAGLRLYRIVRHDSPA
jgi:hypothetical protein